MNAPKRVMIIAGEASGDLYGARLAAEMRRREPVIRFFGMGGDRMRGEGVETLVNADDMAVMGLVEVAAHAPVILRAYSRLKSILFSEPPDLLILIDYQEFNGPPLASCLENPFQGIAHDEDEEEGHGKQQGERLTITPEHLQLFECDSNYLTQHLLSAPATPGQPVSSDASLRCLPVR